MAARCCGSDITSEECRQIEDIVAGLSTPVWQRSIIDNGCDGSMENGSMVHWKYYNRRLSGSLLMDTRTSALSTERR